MSWQDVNKQDPCPSCGKSQWCAWSENGELLRCMREGKTPNGMVCVGSDKGSGTLYKYKDNDERPPQRPPLKSRKAKTKPSPDDLQQIITKAREAFDSDRARVLADSTGINVEAWEALKPGWVDAATLKRLKASGNGWGKRYPDGAFVFVEVDGDMNPVGVSLRTVDGGKGFPKGQSRGLTVPSGLGGLPGPVLIVEGASDVAACAALGIPAVGRPSNKGGVEALSVLLDGRDVIVVGENDVKPDGMFPGRDGAKATAERLAETWDKPVKWSMPPDGVDDIRVYLQRCAPESKPLADCGRELVEGLIDAAVMADGKPPAPRLKRAKVICLADVQPEPIKWLWPERIALGKVTSIAGDPGLGKSFMTLDIAARVSTGKGFPDAPGVSYEPGGVVLLSAEDDAADTIRPRLDAAGADVSKIVSLESAIITDPENGDEQDKTICLVDELEVVRDAIEQVENCKLLIVDPVTAYLKGIDSHKNAEVQNVLAMIGKMAREYEIAIITVNHLNKGSGQAIYRTMGSLAFVSAARAAWSVSKDKDDDERRLFLEVKNNIGNADGMAFSLKSFGDTAQVVWEADPVEMKADDALCDVFDNSENTSRLDEAVSWLMDELKDGPKPAKEILKRSRDDGHSLATIRRAKEKLGVVAKKSGKEHGNISFWHLPGSEFVKNMLKGDADDSDSPPPQNDEQVEQVAHVDDTEGETPCNDDKSPQPETDGQVAQVAQDGQAERVGKLVADGDTG